MEINLILREFHWEIRFFPDFQYIEYLIILTKSRYNELNELNLEFFDDYLSAHYNTDKLLLLNLNMDHENQHNNQGFYTNNNSYNILKCGKEFISYRDKTFVDMEPKKLKKHGLSYFISKLSKYIDYDTLENYTSKGNSNNTSLFIYY